MALKDSVYYFSVNIPFHRTFVLLSLKRFRSLEEKNRFKTANLLVLGRIDVFVERHTFRKNSILSSEEISIINIQLTDCCPFGMPRKRLSFGNNIL